MKTLATEQSGAQSLPPLPAPVGSAALLWEPVLRRSSQKAASWFVTDDMPREGQQLLQGHPAQSYPTCRKDEGAVGVQGAGSAVAAESAGPALAAGPRAAPRPLWGRFASSAERDLGAHLAGVLGFVTYPH